MTVSGLPTLDGLVGGLDFFLTERWRRAPHLHSTGMDFRCLLSEEEIWADLEHGLLTPPYFTVVKEGVARYLTKKRLVNGRTAHGYADPTAIREAIEDGATYKFNSMDHWKPKLKAFADLFGAAFDVRTEAAAFLSPPGHRALPGHTDGMHVFVVQVSGTKSWLVGYLGEDSVSTAGQHGDGVLRPEESLAATLRPGDVLYIPHGSPHQALAQESRSLHLTILLEEPSPLELIDQLLAKFKVSATATKLHDTWLDNTAPESETALRRELRAFLIQGDQGE